MNRRIIIAGPTASGKSSLAVSLAKEIDGEIISADSRQCFKQINIGTAKPTPEQLEKIRHYNISNLDLNQEDSAQDFCHRAQSWMDDMETRGKTVIVAGGSTLHLQGLMFPLDDIPSSSEANLAELQKEMDENGINPLYERLKKVDPVYAKKMDGKNYQRIFRALDVWMQTGRPFSSFHTRDGFSEPKNYSVFQLHWPRKELHERINLRCEQMLEAGLLEETREILKSGIPQDQQALQTVGYKQVIKYLNSEISHEQMVKDFKTATRRYAKRQITWFRRWPFTHLLNRSIHTEPELVQVIKQQVAADLQKG